MGCLVSLGFMSQLKRPGTADRKSMRSAQDACFTWLTRPRSSQELLGLVQAQCACGPAATGTFRHHTGLEVMARLNRSGYTSGKPFFLLAQQILLLFCSSAIQVLTREDGTQQRFYRLHPHRNWPGTWQEMLPHGPKDTTFALIALLDMGPPPRQRWAIMKAMERIVRHCHFLVLPILLSFPAPLIEGIVTSVNSCQHDLEQQADLEDLSFLTDIQDCLLSIKDFLVVLFKVAHEAQRRTIHTAGGHVLLTAYSDAVSMCQLLATGRTSVVSDTANSSRAVLMFGSLGGWMYHDCPDTRNLEINIEAAGLFDKAATVLSTVESDVWKRLCILFHYLERWQQCAAPGCSATEVDAPLWRCTGCHRVRYCSRGCQKQAWRHSIPHRNICGVISQLQTDLELTYRNAIIKVASCPSQPRHFIEWQPSAVAILDHFTQLTEHNMGTRWVCCRERYSQ
jgi:hypothetical protein